MWVVFALLSAVFAALTSILAKIGIEHIDSNLATAIRTLVVVVFAWGIVLFTGVHHQLAAVRCKSWVFLILSGLATGASWLFYYRALQLGEAARVASVDKLSIVLTIILAFFILHEAVSLKVLAGGVLITAGALLMIF